MGAVREPGQQQVDRRALAGDAGRLDPDRAAVRLDDATHEVQPESVAANAVASRIVPQAEVPLEHALLLVWRHAETPIPDADDDAFELGPRLDGDLAAVWPVLNAVAQDVQERLAHPVRVPAR